MSNKLYSVIAFVLLTVLAGNAIAIDVAWTNNSSDGLWKTAGNWSPSPPTIADKAKINLVPGPLIDSGTAAVANHIALGDGGTGGLTITDGTLNVGVTMGDTWIIVAYGGADVGTFTMDGGTVTTVDRVFIGFQGNGTLNMNGGTFNIGGTFGIGWNDAGGTAGRGTVNLAGGTINVTGNFQMSSPAGCLGKLNITGGTLVFTGDKVSVVEGYVNNGYVVAYNGLGDVIINYNGTNTTVTGVTNPYKAKGPSPASNSTDVVPYTMLSWMAGDGATAHDIYFGTNSSAVLDANTSTAGIYQGTQPVEANSFDPGNLELNKAYYWRIDEVNDTNVYKGDLWQFSVASFALIEDFESYADTAGMLGFWSNGSTSATLSLATTGGHKEAKAMIFDYNNSVSPLYSEAQTVDMDFDGTISGVIAMDIWYKGDAGNAAEPMYAAIEDNNSNPVAIVVNDFEFAAQATDWQVWRIELADFTGVNLASIKKLYIGFGNRTTPASGGAGTVYIDDIELHPTRCIDPPAEDLNDDCVIDFKDFAILAGNWMTKSQL
jgi:hypothetical protein